eukprot:8509357-Pyramimonas_sp.AAC.1
MLKPKNHRQIEIRFLEMLWGAVCFTSQHAYACKELYEVPGGGQIDGSPPVPVPARWRAS